MHNLTEITIIWLALPFILAFLAYMLPIGDRILAVITGIISSLYVIPVFLLKSPLEITLLDNFGVSLMVDEVSGFFILTNALVMLAVTAYCWQTGKTAFFYLQLIILHGSVNATFICADLISLYVALEVIGIGAFLLVTYPRTDKAIWVGLRYLFVSNTAMLLYLVGVILVYQTHQSFNYQGLQGSPPEAIALIILGLLIKGGIFLSGLWLPLTHGESQSPVSAMLSGVVVKAGVFPLVRFALILEEINPIVRFFGVATALLGVSFAIFQTDTKRTLAFSTISQLGFVLAAPIVAGFYALTHGLVKSALFLIAGMLPSRNFKELKFQGIDSYLWVALIIASFSISGFPLLSGFGAKVLTSKNLLPWQVIAMNIAALGTAITFAKFIFLPRKSNPELTKSNNQEKIHKNIGFWIAMLILLGSLVAANGFYYQAYTLTNIIKPLLIIFLGWGVYLLIIKKLNIKIPKTAEKFEHLIGVMSLMLILLFWIVWTQSPILI